MKTPNWSASQFLDAPTLNAAAITVSGDFNLIGNKVSVPGIYSPESMTISVSGLVISASLPAPFYVFFGSGYSAGAHGNTTGSDTQSYSVNASGSIPASGSATLYLLASFSQIQQTPYLDVGPPAGHPDYNPTYTPAIQYQQIVNTLTLTASTGAPDNYNFFELARWSVSAGATGLSAPVFTYWNRAMPLPVVQNLVVTGSINVSLANAGRRHIVQASGVLTLPPASQANGYIFRFSSQTSGTVTIAGSGTDVIYGIPGVPSSGVGSFVLSQETAVTLEDDQGVWQATTTSPPPALRLAHGECYFQYTASGSVTLTCKNGCNVLVAGSQYQLPAGGISSAPTSVLVNNSIGNLSANTAYYVSLYNNSGTLALAFWSAASYAHSPDTTSGNIGVEVITSGTPNTAHSLIGAVITNSSGNFQDASGSANIIGVSSWFNKQTRNAIATSTIDTISSASLTEISTNLRITAWIWAGEAVWGGVDGYANLGGVASANTSVQEAVDGSLSGSLATYTTSESADFGFESRVNNSLAEGSHVISPYGSVSNGGGTTLNQIYQRIMTNG